MNYPWHVIKTAFANLFSGVETNYEGCLLTIDCNTVAVFKMSNNNFKVFDSNSRDLYGMPSICRKCVLLTIESFENTSIILSNYFNSKKLYTIWNKMCLIYIENNLNIPSECAPKRKCVEENEQSNEKTVKKGKLTRKILQMS